MQSRKYRHRKGKCRIHPPDPGCERPAVSPFPLGKGETPGIFISILRMEFPKEKLHENGDVFPRAKNPSYRKVVNAGGYSDGGEERTGVVCTVGLLSSPFDSWHRHRMGHFSLVLAVAYSKAAHFGTLCISPSGGKRTGLGVKTSSVASHSLIWGTLGSYLECRFKLLSLKIPLCSQRHI